MDSKYMLRALQLAQQAFELDEVPVGAVIMNPATGDIIAEAHNQVITRNSPCAHAEMLAIQRACEIVGNYRLIGMHLYATLEPCLMCAGAIMQARIEKVLFGAEEPKFGALVSCVESFSDKHRFNHRPEWVGGLMREEVIRLMKTFFKYKRRRLS